MQKKNFRARFGDPNVIDPVKISVIREISGMGLTLSTVRLTSSARPPEFLSCRSHSDKSRLSAGRAIAGGDAVKNIGNRGVFYFYNHRRRNGFSDCNRCGAQSECDCGARNAVTSGMRHKAAITPSGSRSSINAKLPDLHPQEPGLELSLSARRTPLAGDSRQ